MTMREAEPVRLVRVQPVEGRIVRDEVTRAPIQEETTVVYTRAIERRVQAGDLKLIGDAKAPILVEDVQPYVTDDTRLSPDEKSALEEARLRQMGLEKERV